MSIKDFYEIVKSNAIRVRHKMEEKFYSILITYGCDSQQASTAVEQLVAGAYRDGMRQLLASSKLRKLFQNVRKITEQMIIKFSRNRCINPYDLHKLVETGNMDLLKEYQLKQDFPEQYEELERTAKQIRGLLSEEGKKRQFQEVIKKVEEEYDESRLHLGDRDTEVASSEQLRNLCSSNWVFVKQNKVQQVFKTVSNLGIDHEVSRQLIRESTHPKFEEDLITILGSIKPKEPLKNFRAEIKNIHEYYLKQYFMKQEMIEDLQKMIEHYLKEQKQQFETMVYRYGIDGEQQLPLLKNTLLSLISHLDHQFRHYEIDKILNFSWSLLFQRSIFFSQMSETSRIAAIAAKQAYQYGRLQSNIPFQKKIDDIPSQLSFDSEEKQKKEQRSSAFAQINKQQQQIKILKKARCSSDIEVNNISRQSSLNSFNRHQVLKFCQDVDKHFNKQQINLCAICSIISEGRQS